MMMETDPYADRPTKCQPRRDNTNEMSNAGAAMGGCNANVTQPPPGYATASRPNVRQLLYDRINYHTEQVLRLDRLVGALPGQMHIEAEIALADLILNSRPRY